MSEEPPAPPPSFGAELRRRRAERGVSLTAMAHSTHYSKGYLSKIENGRKPVTLDLAERLDAALGAEGELAALVPASRLSPGGGPRGTCPYRGLAAFGPAQAAWFFGRARSTAELVHRLTESLDGAGPVLVVGPSGSGKSSLLRAGLMPALARGALPVEGSARWPVAVITPTATPVAELARALADAVGTPEALDLDDPGPAGLAARLRTALAERGTGRLVLVVDQFEELFTLCDAEPDRRAFVRALCAASSGSRPSLAVVLGVRADFYGRCLEHPELVAVARHHLPLGPMSPDELREAIGAPATAVGLDLEPGLVELLLRDLGAGAGEDGYRAGTLPLLSHALLATWQQREDDRMTVAGYQLTGGIHGAVAATAERVYTGLSEAGQSAARHLLLRLVRVGDGDQDTRRPVARERLLRRLPDQALAAVTAFAAARLLTLDADTVEITHEALLRAWPRLRGWIEADRAGLRARQRLAEAAEIWEADGRESALLYRGTQLALAADWVGDHDAELSALERDFLDSSERQRRLELTARRHRTRRLRQLVAVLSVLVMLTAAATGFALRQRSVALAERDLTAARVVADQAERLRQTDPPLAMQLSLAAYRLARTPQTRGAVLGSSGSVYATRLTGHRYAVNQAVQRGALLATASDDSTVRLWNLADLAHPAALAVLAGTDAARGVALGPDGLVLAAGGTDGTVRLWSTRDPSRPTSLATLTQPGGPVRAVALSPDGRTLAAAGVDGTVRLWDLADPARPVGPATSDGGHQGAVNSVAFSPDGRTLASAGDDHTVRLWDLADPRHPAGAAVLTGHTAQVRGAVFAPDGRTLATVGYDQSVRLWEVTDPHHPGGAAVLHGHTGLVNGVAFRPDGGQLATVGDDETARLWDVPSGRAVAVLPQPNPVRSVAFSPDGGVLTTGDDEGGVLLWHLPPPVLLGPPGGSWAVRYAPDGRLLATAGGDGTARLWDVGDARRPVALATLGGHTEAVNAVAFAPDGRLLATASDDRTARLWDVGDPGRPVALATLGGHTDRVNGLALSPDGRLLATAGGDYQVRLWDVTDPRHPVGLATLVGHANQVNGVAFAPNGRTLATTSDDRTVRLWDVGDPRRPAGPVTLTGHTEATRAVAFSADGRTLVSTGDDRSARLWDVGDPGRPVALATLSGHTDRVADAAFSPDGRMLATVGADSVVRLWDADAEAVARRICALAGPELAPAQWAEYFPDQPYHRPCGG